MALGDADVFGELMTSAVLSLLVMTAALTLLNE
jgi:hypothetical protein